VILEGDDKDRKSALSSASAVNGGSAFGTEQEFTLVRGNVDVFVHLLTGAEPLSAVYFVEKWGLHGQSPKQQKPEPVKVRASAAGGSCDQSIR